MLTKQPDIWSIEPEEAKAVSTAIGNVAKHYPSAAKSQKIVDWVMLMQCIGFAYGPRFYLQVEAMRGKRNEPVA